MRIWRRRLTAFGLALALALALVQDTGRAVLSDVYFTAVNEQVLELNSETMPFWSGGVLYVSSRLFEGTDLGVNFARNSGAGLAMLYTPRIDLRFDLEGQLTYDKEGKSYSGHAIERGGIVFFPLGLVCDFFGLNWTYNRTETVPLIRVTSSNAILSTAAFMDAAAWKMSTMYAEYEKAITEEPEPTLPELPSRPSRPNVPSTPQDEDPPVQAEEGQKVYLVIEGGSVEDTKRVMPALGGAQATFLLRLEQMEDGDLVRGLVSGGHGVGLLASGDDLAEEISRARELVWEAACSWLELVGCGEGEGNEAVLEETGCVKVYGTLDRREQGLRNSRAADSLLRSIGRHRGDVAVYLGEAGGCAGGLKGLVERLEEAGYLVCGWRLTA